MREKYVNTAAARARRLDVRQKSSDGTLRSHRATYAPAWPISLANSLLVGFAYDFSQAIRSYGSVVTHLWVQVLGPLRVLDASGAEIKLASRKSRALLAYLALRPSESHARDRLATLLWENADEELARTSLRQAVASLRKALPETFQSALVTTTDSVALDGNLIRCDVAQFKSACATPTRASLQTAAQLYRGDLLEGFDARSAMFEEWLSNERLLLRREICDALQRLTQLALASQDLDAAATACNRLLVLEPLNEANRRYR